MLNLMGQVPSTLLLLFKTNDCLRHLDNKLGNPINTASGMSIEEYLVGGSLL